MGCEKVSPCGKCCIACSVCTVVILAVMIPVGIFVIAPHVAQNVLDASTISLPNLTQAACPANFTWLKNHAKIHVPGIGPIKASTKIMSYTQEVWTTSCEKNGQITPGALCGKDAIETRLGTYTSPDMTVTPGDNMEDFIVTMDSNSSLILNAWVVPLWLNSQKTRLILTAKDVSVKVMGITLKGLTMRNELTCTGLPALSAPMITIPDKVCYPNDPTHDPYQTQQYTAICVSGAEDIAPTTTTSPHAGAMFMA